MLLTWCHCCVCCWQAGGEDSKEQFDSCLMVQGIQKNYGKHSPTNTTANKAYHLTPMHSPSMQPASHSPLMQTSSSLQDSHSPLMQVSYSPLMQNPVPSHSPMIQQSSYLTANKGSFLIPPVQWPSLQPAAISFKGWGLSPVQDAIPTRPPLEYLNSGMNTASFAQIWFRFVAATWSLNFAVYCWSLDV